MLHAQGVMDLLLELNVRVDLVRYGNGSVKGSESPLASQVLHHFVTNWLLTLMARTATGHIRCFNEILGEATTARALRCGEAATWWPC
jgi:hypothetical protein